MRLRNFFNKYGLFHRFCIHYANIDGKDYKKLSSFFKVILYLDGEFVVDELTPKEHIKLLKRVESTVPGMFLFSFK